MTDLMKSRFSRRDVLAGAAAAGACALPWGASRAQGAARWHRYNVLSDEARPMMAAYQAGIQAMLNLPPTDRRNWYRLGFTHLLDCPHGNWWILPWHRAFTGYVEQMVRELSGVADFAMPYWDWTSSPEVPAIMRQGLFDPNNFIIPYDRYKATFEPVLAPYWQPGSPQFAQLQLRPSFASEDDMWGQVTGPPTGPCFFAPPNARNPIAQLDCMAGTAVLPKTIAKALAPQDFITFASPEAQHHGIMAGSGILEGQPHNLVHNNTGGVVYAGTIDNCDPYQKPTDTGGFMQSNLSPTDPLFFLHHSNLDRLWDLWTRNQQADGLPTLPPSPYYEDWAPESFVFFADGNGDPVTATAGDYATIGAFSYDYPDGTSAAAQPALHATRRGRRPPVQRFGAELPSGAVGALAMPAPGEAAVRLRPALLSAARSPAVRAVLAKLTLSLPPHERGTVFTVLAHTGDPARSVLAGTITMFAHHGGHGPGTFVIAISDALATLDRQRALTANGLLRFRVVAGGGDGTHHGPAAAPTRRDVRIQSVIIETH
jgi:tyrosinase